MKRGTLLAAALAATLATTAWLAVRDDDGDAAEPVASVRPGVATTARPTSTARVPAKSSVGSWPAPPQARASEPWSFDATQASAWVPPQPPPPPKPLPAAAVAAGPPPPPSPPAFPYRLIGRIDDDGSVHALLSGPSRTLGVRERDVIDGQWRVDTIDRNGLTLTWLPGGQSQSLNFRPS